MKQLQDCTMVVAFLWGKNFVQPLTCICRLGLTTYVSPQSNNVLERENNSLNHNQHDYFGSTVSSFRRYKNISQRMKVLDTSCFHYKPNNYHYYYSNQYSPAELFILLSYTEFHR